MSLRRDDHVEFDPDAFVKLEGSWRAAGKDPVAAGASFVVSVDVAVSFYRFAEMQVRTGNATRTPTSPERTTDDVLFWLNRIPVRIRASLRPGPRVGLLSREELVEFDTFAPPEVAPPYPARRRRYRWG